MMILQLGKTDGRTLLQSVQTKLFLTRMGLRPFPPELSTLPVFNTEHSAQVLSGDQCVFRSLLLFPAVFVIFLKLMVCIS